MAELSVNLSAIRANYHAIQAHVGDACRVAGVVKADAYGLGAGPVAKTLYEAGCDLFFVANLEEGIALRDAIGSASDIAVLHGFSTEHKKEYAAYHLTPVLNHITQYQGFQSFARDKGRALPAILHVDTGMNRLGFDTVDLQNLDSSGLDIRYLMSHFSSSDDKNSAANMRQYERFLQASQIFPDIPKSLCNSSGVFRDDAFHLDMVRPGMALYGLNPMPEAENPMQPVVSLKAEILQIRIAQKGETCGYNETYRFDQEAPLAILDIGYADVVHRGLGNHGAFYWNGISCPVRGRVSMDLTIIDISDIPDADMPGPGDMVEIIGPHQSADDLAKNAGTIGYEILTSLGRRYDRVFMP